MSTSKKTSIPSSIVPILLGVIIIGGLILRIQGSLYGLFAYTYDVGRDLLAVSHIVEQHRLPLIGPTTGMEGVFYGPWWYYLLTIPYGLFHGNPVGVSAFMGFLGVITSLLGYLTGKKIGGSFLGLTLASLISFSPQLISNQIWNPYMALPFMMLLFYSMTFLYENKSEKIVWYYFLSGLSLGFIFDSEIFFGMLFAVGTVVGLVGTLRKQISVMGACACIGGFFLVLSPRIIFDVRHGFLISKHFFTTILHGVPQTHYTPFPNRLSFLFDVFRELWINTIANGNEVIGYIALGFCIAGIIFYFKKVHTFQRNFTLLSFVILITYFLYFSTNSTDIFSHFIIGLPLLFVFIFSLTLSFFRTHKRGKVISAGILGLVLFTYLSPWQLQKSFDHSWQGDESVYKNELRVGSYIYDNAGNQEFAIKIFTPTGTDYAYTYLFQFLGSTVYHTMPVPSAKQAYFIIEPDTQYHNYRREIWLDEHKNDGKIVETKTFPGNIIVQKRVY